MSLEIGQILAVSFPKVMAERSKAANQWAESAFMRHLERLGAIKRISFGSSLEVPLDYQRNPNAGFLATDMESVSLVKTEVLTAADYSTGRLSVPITWSKEDEAKNSSENQKIALVKSLIENADESHDDLVEEALFTTVTDGVLGMQNLIADNGEGTIGGINAATEVWWKNDFDTYLDDGTDIEAALTEADNTTTKGTGSKLGVKLIVSGSGPHALYEAQLTSNQRYIDTDTGSAGFKALAFRDKPFIFSQHGGTRIYGINPKSFQLVVSKDAYKKKGETIEIPNQNGFVVKLFSMLQLVTNNRSRLFVLTETT